MPKPKHKKKPFIDKRHENTKTFALVHRSQKDPLAADSDAPQRLLQPITDDTKRKEEQRTFGVFFEDDYDYLQHLKDRDDTNCDWEEVDKFMVQAPAPKIPPKSGYNLPKAVFASEIEEEVGLLNRAAPRSGPLIDWDPDIVETLDDEFKGYDAVIKVEADALDEEDGDLEDALDVLLAEANKEVESSDEYEEVDTDDNSEYGSEADDDVPSLEGGFSFSGEETKSKFTSYSMSSSVIRRNNELMLLDDKFEKFYDGYDDENLGGLDCEEIEGYRPEDSDVMKQVLNDFEKNQQMERQHLDRVREAADRLCRQDIDEEEEKELVTVAEEDPEEKWDCESILTTYSNIYNHPKLISEPKRIFPIKVSAKTGIPKEVLGKGLTEGALKKLDRETRNLSESGSDDETKTLASRVSTLSIRNPHETRDEKKARKKAFKEMKQERRLEKKANKIAFKEEKIRQEKYILNNSKTSAGVKLL